MHLVKGPLYQRLCSKTGLLVVLSATGPGGMRGEPNLQDVVQFLRSGDRTLVSNAASYLQHLAYGDDAMKTKIR